ncbi:MAG: ATP-grasp domain-containing protein [Proteobacteria bacterium]|nr:ATP-grasp domain-containing protein [Pseudomonadota bacterium]
MRIGIHTFAYNVSDESPISSLPRTLRQREHDVVFLDTDKARLENGEIVFPELPADAKLDAFIPYLPSCDWNFLCHGAKPGDVPYFDQLRLLTEKFPTPWPYEIQAVVNNKLQMRDVFIGAGVPIPQTYDANSPESRMKILSEIQAGKKFVFKPCFGGNSEGVIKVSTTEETEEAFRNIDRQGVSFLAQHFIQGPKINDQTVDYRAFVIGDHLLGLACISKNWKRDYDGMGTTQIPHEFTPQQKSDAIRAIRAAKMGMGSVDILIDAKTEQHYISEIGDNIELDGYDGVSGDRSLSELVVEMLEKQYAPDTKAAFCANAFGVTRRGRTPDKNPDEKPDSPASPRIDATKGFRP